MNKPTALPLVREDLCLEFVNTRYWRGEASPTETLHGLDDLLDWCEAGAGVPAAALAPLRTRYRDDAAGAEAELKKAIRLREALNRLFGALATGGRPQPSDLDILATHLNEAPVRRRLVAVGSGFGWAVPPLRPAAVEALAPVLWSAGDLLAGPRLGKVRRCANEKCLYLFVDISRAGNRRWCAMSACGNRAKAQRHYHRRKGRQESHD